MREFLDSSDIDSRIMHAHPKQLSDVDDFLAEERFYEWAISHNPQQVYACERQFSDIVNF